MPKNRIVPNKGNAAFKSTHPEDGISLVGELGVVAVELGLLDLNDHLVVLVASLRASVLLVHVLSASTVVEDSDLSRNGGNFKICRQKTSQFKNHMAKCVLSKSL